MGLEIVEEGSTLVVRLPVGTDPFESPTGERRTDVIEFASAGPNRIKCVSPEFLFQLPLIAIAACESPQAIEAAIRAAWRQRIAGLARVRTWLRVLGCAIEEPPAAPYLAVPIDDDDPEAKVVAVEPGQLILPGRGLLSGIALRRPEDRVFRPDASVSSAVDLELAITTQLESIARLHRRLESRQRQAALLAAPLPLIDVRSRRHRVLLVGPRLGAANSLIESLRLRGYRTTRARGAADAQRAFDRHSYSLVLVDTHLDRSEGLEMIPALRQISGLEEVPVILVDERERPERRDAARKLSAAGYLVHPIQIAKVEQGLARLANTPLRRRFTRYSQQLAVGWRRGSSPDITAQIGRGGMFVVTDQNVPVHALDRFEIALPDHDQSLRVDAEVVYRSRFAIGERSGFGIRFDSFPDKNEQVLINYLRELSKPNQPSTI